MRRIDSSDVKFLQPRQRDETGRVFLWQDRVFRAVFAERREHVHRSLDSGFIDEIVRCGYFPKTWISDLAMEGYAIVLEHECIWPTVYPQEWTFAMLRDAALVVCRVAEIAKRHRFNMRDCHGLNVLFDGTAPKFVDFGSFIEDTYPGWNAFEEFLRFYYYPLKVWQSNAAVGKLMIFSAISGFPNA
jgi:hypothetical protein